VKADILAEAAANTRQEPEQQRLPSNRYQRTPTPVNNILAPGLLTNSNRLDISPPADSQSPSALQELCVTQLAKGSSVSERSQISMRSAPTPSPTRKPTSVRSAPTPSPTRKQTLPQRQQDCKYKTSSNSHYNI